MTRSLKDKPLVEAIMEIKWELEHHPDNLGQGVDPHYKIFLGRLFDKLSGTEGEYPVHEELPTARIPDELVGHIVQHRFMTQDNEWPLIQVGPGVLSLNETENYTWIDFKKRAVSAVDRLYSAHPKPKELRVKDISLRYLNALDFDYEKFNVLEFLRDEFKMDISYPKSFFDKENVMEKPERLNLFSSYHCDSPQGEISLRIGTGIFEEKKALIWELVFKSENISDILPSKFEGWLVDAHQIIEDWFFKLIEGNLERRFRGE